MSELAEVLPGLMEKLLLSDRTPHGMGMSMSALGKCQRQAAYFHLTPELGMRHDDGQTPMAYLGTALHRSVLEDLAALIGGEVEVPVLWQPEDLPPIGGTADLLLDDAVLDLKTVNYPVHEPGQQAVMQVTGYALARGKTWCVLLYLNRATGAVQVFEFRAEDMEAEVLDWWRTPAEATDPDDIPRPLRGPGIDRVCDWCPFKMTCWPDRRPAEPQSVLVVDDSSALLAVEGYDAARVRAKEAAADLEFYRALLTATEGRVGGWSLHWRPARVDQVLDGDAVRTLLADAGLPVPMKDKHVKPAIDLRPAT